MKILGILLFVGGMIVAICSSAKLTDPVRAKVEEEIAAAEEGETAEPADGKKKEESKTPDDASAEESAAQDDDPTFPSTLPLFIFAIAASVGGIFIWRKEIKSAPEQEPDEADPKDNPISHLPPLVREMQQIQKEVGELAKQRVEQEVELALTDLLAPLHSAQGQLTDHSRPSNSEVDTVAGALAEIQTHLTQTRKTVDEIPRKVLGERIDHLIDTYVFPFNQTRHQILDQFGGHDGAEILVTFSGAERMLNRAWSAASDSHFTEAVEAFGHSLQAFAQVDQLIQKHTSASA